MESLYDLAAVFRSKNAGPLYTTIDLLFSDRETYHRVLTSEVLTPGYVAELYGMEPSEISIELLDAAYAIKITFPRVGPTAGAPSDRDVYGAQQHGPLLGVMIP